MAQQAPSGRLTYNQLPLELGAIAALPLPAQLLPVVRYLPSGQPASVLYPWIMIVTNCSSVCSSTEVLPGLPHHLGG